MKKINKAFLSAKELSEKLYTTISDLEKVFFYDKYIEFLKKAAYQGYPEAQFEYAQTFENINYWGENPTPNNKKSFYWYQRAANSGYIEAFNNLAVFYENGYGCKKDIDKAVELYKKGAELGSLTAKRNYKLIKKQISTGYPTKLT